MSASPDDLTGLLQQWSRGSRESEEQLFALVYRDLKRMAARRLSAERAGHTLQPTALVNEAYLRLAAQNNTRWRNRGHFFAMAAGMMRRILVDHARARHRHKRGGGAITISLDPRLGLHAETDLDILAVDEALDRLGRIDAPKARVVELRFFGGLSIPETARALDCSTATIDRHWAAAKAWLFRELRSERTDDP